MGRVVNKSFNQVRKSIVCKADKLKEFIETNAMATADGSWTLKQNILFEKLGCLADSLAEEVSNLDEVEVPEFDSPIFTKKKRIGIQL